MIFEVDSPIDTMTHDPSTKPIAASTPAGDVHQCALSDGDWPAVSRWLRADHVRPVWGDADENLSLLRAAPAPGAQARGHRGRGARSRAGAAAAHHARGA